MAKGSNFADEWLSSSRLPAGTGTTTGEPPALGVRESADTVTSNEITLSTGASPMRNWVELAPAGTGVGEGAAAELPPPPQPEAIKRVARAKRAIRVRRTETAADLKLVCIWNSSVKTLLMTFRSQSVVF